jgi:hypothetical protein
MTKLKDLLITKPPDVPDHPPCAFCGSQETEFMALFGQFLLVSQYYCQNCHSVFEWCKWQAEEGQDNLVTK